MKLLLFFSFFLMSSNTFALNVNKIGDNTFELRGQFDQWTYRDITTLIRDNPKELNLYMNSPGGLANTIIDIALEIKKHGNVNFNIRPSDQCLSACAAILPFGKSIIGKAYFHAVTNIDIYGNRTLNWNQSITLKHAYSAMGVPGKISDKLFKDRIHFQEAIFKGDPSTIKLGEVFPVITPRYRVSIVTQKNRI